MLVRRHEGHVVVLTFARPEARNALSRALVAELVRALEDASSDPGTSAVVLASSHGTVFVAGGDLDELTALPRDERGASAVLEMGSLTEAIEACAVPVIAAVGGAALGGGAELTVACDLVVMSHGASLRFVHGRMGLVPAWGGLTRLEERVGPLRANELLFTARTVPAPEALELGLCNRLTDDALAGGLALAAEVATTPRDALVALKEAAVAARSARRGGAPAAERSAFGKAWGSEAHRRAFDALGRGDRRGPRDAT